MTRTSEYDIDLSALGVRDKTLAALLDQELSIERRHNDAYAELRAAEAERIDAPARMASDLAEAMLSGGAEPDVDLDAEADKRVRAATIKLEATTKALAGIRQRIETHLSEHQAALTATARRVAQDGRAKAIKALQAAEDALTLAETQQAAVEWLRPVRLHRHGGHVAPSGRSPLHSTEDGARTVAQIRARLEQDVQREAVEAAAAKQAVIDEREAADVEQAAIERQVQRETRGWLARR